MNPFTALKIYKSKSLLAVGLELLNLGLLGRRLIHYAMKFLLEAEIMLRLDLSNTWFHFIFMAFVRIFSWPL